MKYPPEAMPLIAVAAGLGFFVHPAVGLLLSVALLAYTGAIIRQHVTIMPRIKAVIGGFR